MSTKDEFNKMGIGVQLVTLTNMVKMCRHVAYDMRKKYPRNMDVQRFATIILTLTKGVSE